MQIYNQKIHFIIKIIMAYLGAFSILTVLSVVKGGHIIEKKLYLILYLLAIFLILILIILTKRKFLFTKLASLYVLIFIILAIVINNSLFDSSDVLISRLYSFFAFPIAMLGFVVTDSPFNDILIKYGFADAFMGLPNFKGMILLSIIVLLFTWAINYGIIFFIQKVKKVKNKQAD